MPVLVARRPPEAPFLKYMVSVEPGSHGDPNRIVVNAVDLTAELGAEPTLIRESGHAVDRILATAAAQGVSLITLGSRGLTGVRALGSVSERVAHRAHTARYWSPPA